MTPDLGEEQEVGRKPAPFAWKCWVDAGEELLSIRPVGASELITAAIWFARSTWRLTEVASSPLTERSARRAGDPRWAGDHLVRLSGIQRTALDRGRVQQAEALIEPGCHELLVEAGRQLGHCSKLWGL
jgi:hypothetical protein